MRLMTWQALSISLHREGAHADAAAARHLVAEELLQVGA